MDDRFIPSRYASNFELSHYKQQNVDEAKQNVDEAKQNEDKADNISPIAKREMQRLLAKHLICIDDINTARVLAYQIKKQSKENLKILRGQTGTSGVNIKDKIYSIKYPKVLYKTLNLFPKDAENIYFINNYYLNFMDATWSQNHILTAISDIVYVWNTAKEIDDYKQFLLKIYVNGREVIDGYNYVSSVAWNKKMLAVGTTKGRIEIWKYNYEYMKRIRFLNNQDTSSVNCLSWYSCDILTSGSRSGKIQHHDIRQPNSSLTINAHHQEVCSLKWSPDEQYLASGGRDNILQIWPSIARQNNHQPIYSLNKHQSAVKALAWCPWQSNILASGGTGDQTIRFWNVNTGNCFNKVDTKSRVCALVWSPNYKEIISGHGKPQNQLTVWKYPLMAKIADLKGHTDRVSYLSMSPDGTTVFSASTDETQKLWYCAEMDPLSMRKKLRNNSSLLFKQYIR